MIVGLKFETLCGVTFEILLSYMFILSKELIVLEYFKYLFSWMKDCENDCDLFCVTEIFLCNLDFDGIAVGLSLPYCHFLRKYSCFLSKFQDRYWCNSGIAWECLVSLNSIPFSFWYQETPSPTLVKSVIVYKYG